MRQRRRRSSGQCHALSSNRYLAVDVRAANRAVSYTHLDVYKRQVIHRIEKDAQFLFIPGAMDYRRAELELRKVNPEDCVFTVREYKMCIRDRFSPIQEAGFRGGRDTRRRPTG